jgi:hypothetical protein
MMMMMMMMNDYCVRINKNEGSGSPKKKNEKSRCFFIITTIFVVGVRTMRKGRNTETKLNKNTIRVNNVLWFFDAWLFDSVY